MKNKHYPDNLNLPENIKQWWDFLQNELRWQRHLLSTCPEALTKAYEQAVNLNALSILISEEMGGTNLDLTVQYYHYKAMAMASGALAFLCAQHMGAAAIIAAGDNADLKDQYLRQNIQGRHLFGVSFAHLKHVINPPVRAIETEGTYIVNGILPYVTGHNIFNTLVLGFVCGDKEIFAVTPFSESNSMMRVGALDLVAATSTNTVVLKLVNHVVDKSSVIVENKLGTFVENNDKRLRHLIALSLGLAAATLDLMDSHEYLEIVVVRDTYAKLSQRLLDIENAVLQLPNTLSTIPLRIQATKLLNQIFLFAEQLVKGQGTLEHHPLVIIRKEAIVITASASSVNTLVQTCELLSEDSLLLE